MKWGQGHVYYFYESEMVTPCVPVLETCTCRGTWEKKTEPRLESVTPMYAQCMVWFKWTLLRRQSWKIFSQITWHLNVLCYIHRMHDQLIKSKHLPPTFTKCGRTHVHMQPEGFTSDVESFRLLSKQGFLVDGDSLCLAFPCHTRMTTSVELYSFIQVSRSWNNHQDHRVIKQNESSLVCLSFHLFKFKFGCTNW